MFHFENYCGIMCAKGRVIWPNTQLPSLLEQMCIWTYDELRDRESKAFEALPVTCGNLESGAFEALPVTYGNTLAAFAMHSVKFDCHEYVQRKLVCASPY